jgi:GTPase SAR1 family protein
MKIAVTGAHRTGKTTLVEELLEALPDYVSKAEAYYELEEAGHVFSEIPGLDEYLLLLEHSIRQVTASGDNVIFDRCPIDMLAYIQAVSEYDNFDIRSMYQRVQQVMNEIDLLVFVTIENPDRIGCQESDLPELRERVNDILSDWIWDFNIDAVEVSGSLEARINQVMEHIAINN